MESQKTYSVEEIEAMLPDIDTFASHFLNNSGTLRDIPQIIRQLLAQNQQLSAKVAEAERVEAMLKKAGVIIRVPHADRTLQWDGSDLHLPPPMRDDRASLRATK